MREKYFVLCLICVAALWVVWPALPLKRVQAQGSYPLTISGEVKHPDGRPSAFTYLTLSTDDQSIRTQTNFKGEFILTGTLTAGQGTLTLRSAIAEHIVLGQTALNWAAGGYEENKEIIVSLRLEEDGRLNIVGGGTHLPLSTLLPPTPLPTPSPMPGPEIKTQAPQPQAPSTASFFLVLGLVIGFLIFGGVFLIYMSQLHRNG